MTDWTDEELEATIIAYLDMRTADHDGRPYNKAEVNAALREGPLKTRTKGSVEYRMQNLSAVLNELGHEWLTGYKPAGNVGLGVKNRLLVILARHGIHPL